MAEYDFFDLTELPFDPPETNKRKIRLAIEKARKNLEGRQGNASQDEERQEIAGKLRFLREREEELLGKDGPPGAMARMAGEKTAAVRQQLAAAVELSKFGKQTFIVTIGAVRLQKRRTRLSQKSVEEVYQEKGFTIEKTDPLAAYPKFPVNAESLYHDLARLRTMKDPNPSGPDTSGVTDLYAFCAYISGEPENAAEYRTRPTADLCRTLNEYATRYAARNDPLGKLCVSIATKGKTYVFSREEDRKAYEQHLLYKDPELTRLFTLLRDVSDADKRSAAFAENCVRQIARVFGDSDAALAIYNKEAGLQDQPYLPEAAVYYVPCARCGTLCQFPSFDAARKTNRCTQCGAALFKSCPKCGKPARASLDRCPECGFLFHNAGQFEKYTALAEAALLRGDVDEARKNLGRARGADPGGAAHTADLERRIEQKAREIDAPRRKLRQLMDERKYMEASRLLPRMKLDIPGLNVTEQEAEIRRTLDDCRGRFQSVRTRPPRDAARLCQAILTLCADFTPALEYLRETPPPPPSALQIVAGDASGAVFLSWKGCGEPGAEYRVVRRDGSAPPRIPQDGQTLCAATDGLSWQDSTAAAGRDYAYSVFSLRAGAHSPPVSGTVKTLFPVRDVQCRQEEDCVHITWAAPSGCQGVSIMRRVDGGPWTSLGTYTGGSYDDRDVRRGSLCTYLLTALYGGFGSAAGVQTDFRPTAVVRDFQIALKSLSDDACEISWTIPSPDVDIRILVDGRAAERVRSDRRSQRVPVSKNQLHSVRAEAFSGGTWIPSANTLEFNTFTSCPVGECRVTESAIRSGGGTANRVDFTIPVQGEIPSGVSGFVYAVRTRTDRQGAAPYLSRDALETAPDRRTTTLAQYRHDGGLRCSVIARDEETYYLTVCTVYKSGQREILSSHPARKRIQRPLSAELYWQLTSGVFQKPKLSLTIRGNRPLSRRPRLLLCAAPGGGRLLSPHSPDAELLLELPEETFPASRSVYQGEFPLDAKPRRGTPVFLFLPEAMAHEMYLLRWAEGFAGKA